MARGRPKEFKESQALEKAMSLFWSRGYQGVGLSELLDHMGIARQSLYDTFGNKRQLYIRTLEHYRDTRLNKALALLQQEGSPVRNVREVIGFFRKIALDRRHRGCLVANALVELGPHDRKVAGLIQDILSLLEAGFHKALTQARKQGEIERSKSPRALSRALTNAVIGMSVTGRLPAGRVKVPDIFQGTLSMLN